MRKRAKLRSSLHGAGGICARLESLERAVSEVQGVYGRVAKLEGIAAKSFDDVRDAANGAVGRAINVDLGPHLKSIEDRIPLPADWLDRAKYLMARMERVESECTMLRRRVRRLTKLVLK